MKNIVILGATGSIGKQTIDVIKHHSDEFSIRGLSVGYNIKLLKEYLHTFHIPYVCVINEEDAVELSQEYPDTTFFYGEEGLLQLVHITDIDIVLNAIVGFAGLLPTIEAIKQHIDIALANKETLVAAGHIIMPLVKEYNVKLLPVDSEHSAIFQCLQGIPKDTVSKIILTCSGGSFRDKTLEELENVTLEEALNHPNWSMGAKITIDSATLVNKGLEVMEAKWLFDKDYDDIEVVIHPESVIHSMVETVDYAVLAQLGTPDMRLPIQYALTYPNREKIYNSNRLDFNTLKSLTFYTPDTKRFPALKLAYQAGIKGGSMPCVYNSANEKANELFREGKIPFIKIVELIEKAMNAHKYIDNPTLDQLLEIDMATRLYVEKEVLR